MNKTLFLYKRRFFTVILLLGYAFIHMHLTGVYIDASFGDLINFSARLPYGQRLFVPTLVKVLTLFLPWKLGELFFLMEWLFVSLFYLVLNLLLRQEFNQKQAQILSWLFILLLPLTTVINYQWQSGAEASFFYASDTASLFFITLGFFLCLQKKWFFYILLIFLATFNRETSFLLVLLIPALHWQQLNAVKMPLLFGILGYLLARSIILLLLSGVSGQILEWFYRDSNWTHFQINLLWLLEESHLLLFIYCFAGLPLLWFTFYDFIPLQYRPLRYVVLFCFLVLLFVGNFLEPRIFIEILVLLYLPVCVAINNWIKDAAPMLTEKTGFLYYLNRYFILAFLLIIILLRQPINSIALWVAHYF